MKTMEPKRSRESTVAVYAFSADPITFGHVNIVERASRIFGRVILLNAALLVEAGMLPQCNNRVLLVDVSSDAQLERLADRGHSPESASHRIQAQMSGQEKAEAIQQAIEDSRFGELWQHNGESHDSSELEQVFREICGKCGVDSHGTDK